MSAHSMRAEKLLKDAAANPGTSWVGLAQAHATLALADVVERLLDLLERERAAR